MKEYMNMALDEANKAYLKGEIPVGCIITYNGEIIAKTHNLKETMGCSLKHAEIIAIEEASKKINDWRLNECEMYVTMEPCIMCLGALIQARIKKVYYLVPNYKFGGINIINQILNNDDNNHKVIVEKINDDNLCKQELNLLRDFFKNKR